MGATGGEILTLEEIDDMEKTMEESISAMRENWKAAKAASIGTKANTQVQGVLETTMKDIFNNIEKINKRITSFFDKLGEVEARLQVVQNAPPTSSTVVNCPRHLELEKKVNALELIADERHQWSIKGNLILTSPNLPGKPSHILSDGELESADTTLEAHVVSLIKDFLGVDISEAEIMACHRLGKEPDSKSIILRFCDRSKGSAWERLHVPKKRKLVRCAAGENVFLNYQLTPYRSVLAANIRAMFKSGAIAGHFVDCNGRFQIYKAGEGGAVATPLKPCTLTRLEEIVGTKGPIEIPFAPGSTPPPKHPRKRRRDQ